MRANQDRFKLISVLKKFYKVVKDDLVNFPRREFVLKDRIEHLLYEILELAFLANVQKERLETQKQMMSKLNMLDFCFEISYELKCINEKKLHLYCRYLDDINKMMYGWVKSDGSTAS